MKNKKKQIPSWPDVKVVLAHLDQPDLLDLISDLYHLSRDNKDFLKEVMLSTEGMGWGYHDGLCDEYYDSFHDDE